ncbi:hypothetical protein QFZ53_001434 [Microbacterium natoriense]|uniref:DUF4238 domain-containing protein n=1 Tax=Microbacterium natoriense TaxID=284570 RepID=A0AAW8EVD5_9MICO|nr:hypothetical protein [Microbacterium natoriense]
MTAAGIEPRRHHLLPAFYLDRWADGNRVRVTDLLRNRNAYETAPRSAALETDFYRLQEANGISPVYWEAWLSEVEGHAATALREIDAERMLSDESQQWLCLFLATQMMRGRKARRGHRALFAAELAQVRAANGDESLAEELRKGSIFNFADADDVPTIMAEVDRVFADPEILPITRENDLEALATLATHVAGLLTTRHLALYRTRRALITSDEPVVELHENRRDQRCMGECGVLQSLLSPSTRTKSWPCTGVTSNHVTSARHWTRRRLLSSTPRSLRTLMPSPCRSLGTSLRKGCSCRKSLRVTGRNTSQTPSLGTCCSASGRRAGGKGEMMRRAAWSPAGGRLTFRPRRLRLLRSRQSSTVGCERMAAVGSSALSLCSRPCWNLVAELDMRWLAVRGGPRVTLTIEMQHA